MRLFSLNKKVAVVTGASGAIGGAIALGFAEAGADLALCCNNNRAGVEEVAGKARVFGVTARCYQFDARDPEAFRAHAREVANDFGACHILVNCVGGNIRSAMTGGEKTFFDLSPEAFAETMHNNFTAGVVAACLAYGPLMLQSGGGSIINISSMNAYRPLEGRPAYAASKAAVSNFTAWLAAHVAKECTPLIRVNAIAPGFFPNQRMRDTLFNADGSFSERGQAIISHTPMGRFGDPAELAGTAIWYASEASAFVTGTTTPVDGGFNAYAGL